MNLKSFLIGALLAPFFFSCDFTPRIHKEILVAQKYIENQEYEKSIEHYKKILEGNPNNEIKIKIYYQLGDLLSIYLNKSHEALEYYQKVISLTDEVLWMVKTQERMGEIYFSYLKDYESSLPIYRRLSQFTPSLQRQDFYQFRYAQSFFKLGNLEKAREVFVVIKKDPRHQYYNRSIYFMGLSFFEQKKWVKAINLWQEYLNLETRNDNIVQTKFLMANAYETMERLKEAYNLYYSILGEYPNTEVIQNRLQAIYDRKVSRKR